MMIEIDSSIISAQVLLERVRRDVLNKNIHIDRTVPMESVDLGAYADAVKLNLTTLSNKVCQMDQFWQIQDTPIVSKRPIIGKFIILFKRCIRKSIYWFIRPYWDQQICFNSTTMKSISEMLKVQQEILEAISQK